MEIYVNTNDDSRVIGWMPRFFTNHRGERKEQRSGEDAILVEIPAELENADLTDYVLVNGALEHRPDTERREREAAEAKERKQREKLMGELPEILADSDAAICELYETALSQSETIAEQDAAICELYEMIMEV